MLSTNNLRLTGQIYYIFLYGKRNYTKKCNVFLSTFKTFVLLKHAIIAQFNQKPRKVPLKSLNFTYFYVKKKILFAPLRAMPSTLKTPQVPGKKSFMI